jgi:hypothetical protein
MTTKVGERAALQFDAAVAKAAAAEAEAADDLIVATMTLHKQGVAERLWGDDGASFAFLIDTLREAYADMAKAVVREAGEKAIGRPITSMPDRTPPLPKFIRARLLGKICDDVLDYARDRRKAAKEAQRRKELGGVA